MAILDRAGRKPQVHLWRGNSSLFCTVSLAFSTILPYIKFKTQVAVLRTHDSLVTFLVTKRPQRLGYGLNFYGSYRVLTDAPG